MVFARAIKNRQNFVKNKTGLKKFEYLNKTN